MEKKEAMKILKDFYDKSALFSIRTALDTIIPELKESEDEKIRKELIQYLKDYPNLPNGNYCRYDFFAWLEKQGEQKSLYIRFGDIPNNEKSKIYRGEEEIGEENGVSVYPAFESNGDIVIGLTLPITRTSLHTQQHLLEYDNRPCYLVSGDCVGKGTDGEPLIRNICIIKQLNNYRIKETEKQGEQKPFDYENANIPQKEFAPKVEPKFHEGEWVIFNGLRLFIKEVVQGYYRTISLGGIPNSYDWDIDNVTRLWTLDDVRDGDVLVNGSNIFIFHFINDTRLMGYCHINTDDGRFYDDIGKNECFCLIDAVVNPATKEQHEQLEKAMADAGYTFDFEKKELKKIKHKYAENKGMNLVEEEMTPFQKKVFCIIDTAIEEEQGLKQVCDELLRLAHDEIKQKSAWSEDDEIMIRQLTEYFTTGKGLQNTNETVVEWLNDIKEKLSHVERKQEWSEEDEKILNSLISSLARIGASTRTDSTSINYTFSKEIDWLTSIKDKVQPQSQQEWSEEDEKQFSFCCAAIELSNYSSDEYRNYAISFLESLKDRVGCEANCTTTKAWSEEDEAHFDSILKRLEGMCKPWATYTATRCSISEDKDWLKSLKDKYTWKPSEEQMNNK